jgi:hypothetical protein
MSKVNTCIRDSEEFDIPFLASVRRGVGGVLAAEFPSVWVSAAAVEDWVPGMVGEFQRHAWRE